MGVDVELDGVSKRYTTGPDQVIVALDDVNLAVQPGAVLGVAGPSALTAVDNVAAPLIPYRTEFDKFDRARQLLDAVGPGDRATSLPSRLSGGEQQRVAIARALINDPGLLLAGRAPTGNLHSRTGERVMELLLELRRARAMTMIVATHDPVIAQRCDKILRLLDGRVVEELEPSEVPWP